MPIMTSKLPSSSGIRSMLNGCGVGAMLIKELNAVDIKLLSAPVSNKIDAWKRISDKRTKNQAKNDKTKHEMEKTKSNRSQRPRKSKSKVNPQKSTVKTEPILKNT
ncbi:hypothetical protein Tco_0078919 [Tanacetum coccineum]